MHVEEGGEKDEKICVPDDDDPCYCEVTILISGKEVLCEDVDGEIGWSEKEWEDAAWEMYTSAMTEEEYDELDERITCSDMIQYCIGDAEGWY